MGFPTFTSFLKQFRSIFPTIEIDFFKEDAATDRQTYKYTEFCIPWAWRLDREQFINGRSDITDTGDEKCADERLGSVLTKFWKLPIWAKTHKYRKT